MTLLHFLTSEQREIPCSLGMTYKLKRQIFFFCLQAEKLKTQYPICKDIEPALFSNLQNQVKQ